MPVCVDASFPLEFLLGDKHAAASLSRWLAWLRRSEMIVSPPLFRPEVTSAIRKRAQRGQLTDEEGAAALARALRWPVRIWPDDSDSARLQTRAFELATRFDQRHAYDAQYLSVAESMGCELWTADEKLYNAVRHELPWVHWVGSYRS